jgi:phage terminase small subunit
VRRTFPSSLKWKDETVDSKASVLANSDKVLERIRELKEQASSEAVKTAIQRKEWLSSVIDDDSIDINAKLKACDLLNKMDGEYVTKVEADVNTEMNINIELSDD